MITLRSKSTRIALLIGLVGGVMGLAHGFGSDGHRAVGAIAWDRLEASTREQIEALIGPGSEAFVEACTWPDQVKYTAEYQLTRPLHYVNMPRGEDYDPDRHCRAGNCLPKALSEQMQILFDRQQPRPLRIEAVKFVCHFVADLHQPLHVGYAHDRGGNRHDVALGPLTINLHEIWDRVIPAFMGHWRDIVQQSRDVCELPRSTADILGWMQESRELLEIPGLIYPTEATPDGAWFGRGVVLVQERICRAGRRLGWVLDELLARPVPPS